VVIQSLFPLGELSWGPFGLPPQRPSFEFSLYLQWTLQCPDSAYAPSTISPCINGVFPFETQFSNAWIRDMSDDAFPSRCKQSLWSIFF
jgi:hypothetical protein